VYGLFADKWLTKLKNDVSGFQTKEDLQMKKLFLSSFFTDVSLLPISNNQVIIVNGQNVALKTA